MSLKDLAKNLGIGISRTYQQYGSAVMQVDRATDAKQKETAIFYRDALKTKLDEQINEAQRILQEEQLRIRKGELAWKQGEPGRADVKRSKDAQSEIDTKLKIDEEKRKRDDADAEAERERQAKAREELDSSLAKVYPDMSPEERRIIVDEEIPEKSKSDLLAKAEALEDIRLRNPEATEAEILEIYRKQNEPRTSDEASKAMQALADKREAKRMFEDGEIDQETYDWTIKNIDSQFRSGTGGTSDLSRRADYIRERFKDDPEKMQTELDGLYLEASSGSKDPGEIQQYTGIIRRYEKGSDNRELALMISANHKTAKDKLAAIQELDFILDGAQNIEDLDAENLDDVSQYLSKVAISAPGKGEVIKKLDAANRLIAKQLPALYEQYKRLKEQGKDIGRFIATADRGVRWLTGTTVVDPEVLAFQQQMGYLMEEVLRFRTGAVINDEETARAERDLPSYGVEAEVNDVLFLTQAIYTAGRQRGEYEGQLGDKWGEQVARRDLAKNYKIINELKPGIMGKTDTERSQDYWNKE